MTMKHERDDVKRAALPFDHPVARRIETMNTHDGSACSRAEITDLGWDSETFVLSVPPTVEPLQRRPSVLRRMFGQLHS
jgi:hypothetical protein